MLDRAACERRVYRLAVLLTGNPISAVKVIGQVVDAQPDLSKLDSAHLDRLTVLRSREIKAAMLVDDRVPRAVAAWLADLDAQVREAWVFRRVYQLNDREMARAMDCSSQAGLRHLEQADRLEAERLAGLAPTAAPTLLSYSMQLDVPRFYRMEQRQRQQRRLAWFAIFFAVLAVGIALLLMWWSRPLSPS